LYRESHKLVVAIHFSEKLPVMAKANVQIIWYNDIILLRGEFIMKKIMAAALLLTLPLTACGTGSSRLDEATSSIASTVAISTASPIPTLTATPLPTPTPTAPKEEITKSYIMNKNYDFVPKDPTGNKKVVLLTFDDGPKEKEMIEPMLDILDKHKAKAIFFMNGYRIKAHPELLQLVHERGQIIGNHSWDHINLKKESNAKIDQQLKDVQQIIKETIGVAPIFFRPPFGSGNDHVHEVAKQENMLYMTWSNGSLDWDMENKGFSITTKSENLIKNVFDQLHSGSNILMHELPWTVAALDKLLTQLEEKGYSFLDPRAIDTEAK
jgi:peptidoglycan/xylan/chitin deacetylase (PgdA/CDA1 family)